MWACASSSWTMLMAEPKAFRLGASWAALKYAGALMSSVSAETVRMRLMPSRYVGDMCSRPSTSRPLLMRWSVVASLLSSTAIGGASSVGVREKGIVGQRRIVGTQALEVAAARPAAVLAQQQLRGEHRDQLA